MRCSPSSPSNSAANEQVLEWSHCHGRRLTPIDHIVFNGFLGKRGWNDEVSPNLESWLDEGRPPPA